MICSFLRPFQPGVTGGRTQKRNRWNSMTTGSAIERAWRKTVGASEIKTAVAVIWFLLHPAAFRSTTSGIEIFYLAVNNSCHAWIIHQFPRGRTYSPCTLFLSDSLEETKKSLTKQRRFSLLMFRQALVAMIISCADSLSANFHIFQSNGYYSLTHGTFNFYNPFCVNVNIEQSLVLTTRAPYMYLFHLRIPPLRPVVIRGTEGSLRIRFCRQQTLSFFSG